MIISVDNYEEILSGEKDSEKAHIMIQADKLLENYFDEHNSLLRKLSNDKFIAVAEERDLKKMAEDKFKILDNVRKIPVSEKSPVTLYNRRWNGSGKYLRSGTGREACS